MLTHIIDFRPLLPTCHPRVVYVLAVIFSLIHIDSMGDEQPSSTGKKPELRVLRNVAYATVASSSTTTSGGGSEKPTVLRADVYLPANAGPHPGALLLHGGGWTTGSKLQMGSFGRRLAKSGFVGIAIDYRLAPTHLFPAQVEDCLKALEWIKAVASGYGIDTERIAAVGYSAGAQLACLIATTPPTEWGFPGELPRIRAVVAGGAPCNFETMPPDKSILAHWLGGTRNEVPHLYRKASPLRAASKDAPPMFFYHGSDDHVVPSHVSRQMADRLQELGVPVEYYLCEHKGHVSAFFDMEAGMRSVAFLERVLGPDASNHPGVVAQPTLSDAAK